MASVAVAAPAVGKDVSARGRSLLKPGPEEGGDKAMPETWRRPSPAAGWWPDPRSRDCLRWFDGLHWTVRVRPAANSPGWYTDPSDPTIRRWWDGTHWTERTKRPPIAPWVAFGVATVVIWVLMVLGVVGLFATVASP